MRSDQTAIALLKPEQVLALSALLKAKDLLSDILESGQHFDQPCTIVFRNRIRHIRRHDRFDKVPVVRQPLQSLCLANFIICQQTAGHISGQCMIFSGLCILYTYTKTVGIRVRRQYKIRIDLLCQLQSECKCLIRLRIWIADSREITVRKLLLRNHIYMLKAKLL